MVIIQHRFGDKLSLLFDTGFGTNYSYDSVEVFEQTMVII